jgi:hypothetical protein
MKLITGKKFHKNIIAGICLFIIYLTIFISAAYARKSDNKPSEIVINNAIYWAQSLVGRPSFPVIGTSGYCWSAYKCTDFVANAYGCPASPYHAELLWATSGNKHPGDWNAPRGSLVYFSRSSNNGERGHVALCTGNGNLIEAGNEIIIESTIIDESHSAAYLGWAWPPSIWHGRNDVFIATASTWAIQIGKAVILAMISWWIFFIVIRKIMKQINTTGFALLIYDQPAHAADLAFGLRSSQVCSSESRYIMGA